MENHLDNLGFHIFIIIMVCVLYGKVTTRQNKRRLFMGYEKVVAVVENGDFS